MLLNGLVKGVLMLVVAAFVTWALVVGFESRARDQVSTNISDVVPKIAHVPTAQGPFE